MKCFFNRAVEESRWDVIPEEQGPGGLVAGRSWAWRGKHRRDAAGGFVCAYKSWRTRAKKEEVEARAPIHRDGLARDSNRDVHERGTTVGKVCKDCGRLITSVVSHEEWLAYQGWREQNTSYGGPRSGYRAWFEPGAHGKAPGGKAGRRVAGKHTGKGEGFRCNYISVMRRGLRIKAANGGCARCGRLRSEGA